MYYVEVLVADVTYHGGEALTYSSAEPLAKGAVVSVPLRSKQVLGIVASVSRSKPSFATKSVVAIGSLPPLPQHNLDLLLWMQAYYPAPLGVITQHFLPRKVPRELPAPKAFTSLPELNLPPLTTDQRKALAGIRSAGTHLLHGATGSGKTRVYIELAHEALAAGRSAIVLTPEISLTSQLAHNFSAVFGERVVTIHSQLTDTTRQALWFNLLQQKEPVVIIGPRSALFSPLRNVGLIVVDESHETAYKQDQAPYYHATTVAAKLASLHQAKTVLGSATPLVGDYYLATQRKRPIIRMTQTATGPSDASEAAAEVIDLRDKAQFSKSAHLSNQLLVQIERVLAKHEQALLFLNRRGTARIIFCEHCGWQAACPHCDLPLVYHCDKHAVRCHTCDYKNAAPSSCPECHNPAIVFRAIGTKAIADEVQRLFPTAVVQRFDTDNSKAERIEQHYPALRDGKIDIIVGTQMLAKGLDLPKLGLVGVVIADTSLYFPDFSASERTYQLLSQVLGRVGRGHRSSSAVIQTYSPDSPLLQAVLIKDWSNFYNKELAERRQFLFPPFCYLLKLTCRRATPASAQRAAQTCLQHIKSLGLPIAVDGPAPAFHEKIQGKSQWQLVVKAKRRQDLLTVIASLPANWSHNIDPMNLL